MMEKKGFRRAVALLLTAAAVVQMAAVAFVKLDKRK